MEFFGYYDHVLSKVTNEVRINSNKYGPGMVVGLSSKSDLIYVKVQFDNNTVPPKSFLLKHALEAGTVNFFNEADRLELDGLISKLLSEENSVIARFEERRKNRKKSVTTKPTRVQEREYKNTLYEENIAQIDKLWQKMCEASTDFPFLGFHHHADFKTFQLIWESGYVKSRNGVKDLNIPDVGDQGVMEHTSEKIKNCARFYCGPNTPTYYDNEGIKYGKIGSSYGNVPIPVALIFGKSILTEPNCWLSEGNACSKYSDFTNSYKTAMLFHWHEILSRAPCEKRDMEAIRLRNAELLVEDKVSLKHLAVVAFRTEADKKHAEYLYGQNVLFQVMPKMFKSPESIREYQDETGMSYYENTYLKDYRVRRVNNAIKVDLQFIKPVEKYTHELNIYYKDGNMKSKNIKVYGISGTLTIVEEFDKIDHFEYLLNGNVSAIWR